MNDWVSFASMFSMQFLHLKKWNNPKLQQLTRQVTWCNIWQNASRGFFLLGVGFTLDLKKLHHWIKKRTTCTVCYVIYTWKLYWIVLNESMFCNNTSLMFFIMLICFMIYVYIRNINENALCLATLKDFNNDLGPWQIHTCPWFTWNTES